MDRRVVPRAAGAVVVAFLFGAAASVLKGNGWGVRAVIGNMSAPWLLVPFIAGALTDGRRIRQAAFLGTVASLVALGGFYFANTFVLDLGPHPWLVDLRLTMRGGQQYFMLAAVSGPVFGVLGGWWQRRRATWPGILMAATFVLEPLAWLGYEHNQSSAFTDYPLVWTAEVAIGMGAFAIASTFLRPRPSET
jgi:hypothetical protein